MTIRDQVNTLPQPVVELCGRLRESANKLDESGKWPAEQLSWCAAAGVFKWFMPKAYGGFGWNDSEVLEGYLALSQACLTTTFVLTQWNAACKRIVGSSNDSLKDELLPRMADGEVFATVGISHLTTSRQHIGKPVLTALPQDDGGYVLHGFSPWVTGAAEADVIVLGATLPDATQIICSVPRTTPGVNAKPGERLVALTSSCTDQVDINQVRVLPSQVVAGPVNNVLATNSGGGAGGLQTSTLAVGLALAAVKFLQGQAAKRSDLTPIADKIAEDCQGLVGVLRDLTASRPTAMSAAELRQKANSLALRATQAALSAAKGAGFVASHPTGRWAREALFFLVWSCPQPVVAANLCELAQLVSAD